MSSVLFNGNETDSLNENLKDERKRLPKDDNENSNDSNSNSNPILKYYNKYIPNCRPIPIYKNTKFYSIDCINGGNLTKDEKNDFILTNNPTGYKFNLDKTGYFIIDIDVNPLFKANDIKNNNYYDDAKLLSCNDLLELDSLPDKIELNEFKPNG